MKVSQKARIWCEKKRDYVTVDFDVEIDVAAILEKMGPKARCSKVGKSVEIGGAVKVFYVQDVETLYPAGEVIA